MKADKVYLVGFMGAGKTTAATALGKRLDWKAEDIDARIERLERRDIPSIFRQDGEPYFRAREREAHGASSDPPWRRYSQCWRWCS